MASLEAQTQVSVDHAYAPAPTDVDMEHGQPQSLSEWITNIRRKTLKARRRRGDSLRAVAILSRALRGAQDRLVAKQRDRAQRWAAIKASRLVSLTSESLDHHHQQQEKPDPVVESMDRFFRELKELRELVMMAEDLTPLASLPQNGLQPRDPAHRLGPSVSVSF